jgi:uncharacterized protein YbjT (DUF2867 family)
VQTDPKSPAEYAAASGDGEGRQAILLGASGLVGGHCLQALVAAPGYSRIVVINRRELPVATLPRVVQRIADFDKLDENNFLGGGDIFCALGTTIRKAGSQPAFRRVDFDYPLAAARLAREADAKQFLLVSSVGADADSGNFYLRTKGELEQEMGKLGFPAVHILRPSLLLGRREEFRLGERVVQAIAPALNAVMLGGLRRYRAIAGATVGKAMVAAARKPGDGVFVHEYDAIVGLAG